jgi:hypothetical protein
MPPGDQAPDPAEKRAAPRSQAEVAAQHPGKTLFIQYPLWLKFRRFRWLC